MDCSDWSKSCWCRADAWEISSWRNICSCRGCVLEPMRANSPLLSSAVTLWTQSYHTSICMQGAQCSIYQNTLTYTQVFQYFEPVRPCWTTIRIDHCTLGFQKSLFHRLTHILFLFLLDFSMQMSAQTIWWFLCLFMCVFLFCLFFVWKIVIWRPDSHGGDSSYEHVVWTVKWSHGFESHQTKAGAVLSPKWCVCPALMFVFRWMTAKLKRVNHCMFINRSYSS